MDDIKICDLAANVLNDLVRDMNASIYSKAGGELGLKWSTKPGFAVAESDRTAGNSPAHSITMHYSFVIQLYRRSEKFQNYRKSECGALASHAIARAIPHFVADHFSDRDFVGNMFLGSLTWVFFHEIGHLVQEHGMVRARMLGIADDQRSAFAEAYSSAHQPSLRESSIDHALELAADAISTVTGVSEWIRHVLDPDFIRSDATGKVFLNGIQAYACGVTSVLYLFRSSENEYPDSPTRSHPHPIYRLELILPTIQELLCHASVAKHVGLTTSVHEAVAVVGGGAYLSAHCWMEEAHPGTSYFDGFLFEAITSRKKSLRYLAQVIPAWDEASQIVKHLAAFPQFSRLAIFSGFIRQAVADFVAEQISHVERT
jgi:hypothetical protein